MAEPKATTTGDPKATTPTGIVTATAKPRMTRCAVCHESLALVKGKFRRQGPGYSVHFPSCKE